MSVADLVLLVGATGFLGSHLLRELLASKYEIIVLKRSSSSLVRIQDLMSSCAAVYDADDMALEEVFSRHQITVVINTITNYGRNGETVFDVFEPNLSLGLKLLDIAGRRQCGCYMHAGSWWPSDMGPYSLAKRQLAEWGHLLKDKVQFLDLRIQHMYGAGDWNHKFLPWLVSQLEAKIDVIPLSWGAQVRDFVHVTDVVSAFRFVLEHRASFQRYEKVDVGSGTLVTIKEVVEALYQKYLERQANSATAISKLHFGALGYRENEPLRVPENDRILFRLGWTPSVVLSDGLAGLLSPQGK